MKCPLMHWVMYPLIAGFCIVSFSGSTRGETKDAQQIVKQVKRTLDTITTLSCSFTRSFYMKESDTIQNINGTLLLKHPNKFRVEYSGQTIVTDGKTVWTYYPMNKQVQITDVEKGDNAFPTPYTIFRHYAEGRKAILAGSEQVGTYLCDIVTLAPPNTDETQVTVWIDQKTNLPVKSVEEFPSGNRAIYTLSEVRVNEKANDSNFTLVPPEGTDVLDLRE